jgi:hypothetical protein
VKIASGTAAMYSGLMSELRVWNISNSDYNERNAEVLLAFSLKYFIFGRACSPLLGPYHSPSQFAASLHPVQHTASPPASGDYFRA